MLNPGMPVLLASLICFFARSKKQEISISLIALTVSLAAIYYAPGEEVLSTASFLDMDLILAYIQPVSRNTGVIFAAFAIIVLIYGWKYLSAANISLLNLFVGSSLALLFVGDFISFFFFWELITVAAFFLIFDRLDSSLRFTAEYYFIVHIMGGLSLLFGIILHYSHTGGILLTFPEKGLPFFLLGIAIKLGFIGVHTWIPRTYAVIPFQLSVLMSAYTSKIGVYALYRLIELEGSLIAYLGVINALAGGILALSHSHLRLIISYSIVSQIGYMMVGIGAGGIAAVGGMFHLINHILYKGLLFMMAGSLIHSLQEENLKNLGGLWHRLPVTFAAGLVAALSISGVPLFNGYVSKAWIKAGIEGGFLYYGLQAAGILTSLTFIKVLYFGFFSGGENATEKYKNLTPPTLSMRLSMLFMILIMSFTALNPAAMEQFYAVSPEIDYFSYSEITGGLQPFILAIIIFPFLKKYIKPHPENAARKDYLTDIGYTFINLDRKISDIHSGDLIRYLSWALLALIILMFSFLLGAAS